MPAYKNEFGRPAHYDHDIRRANRKLGTLRVKPGGLLWKPKGQQKFYSVSLEQFEKWITSSAAGANRTGS